MGDVEEKDMGGEGVGAPPGEEGVAVKQEVERVAGVEGESEDEFLVKNVPNDELNSKIAHDVDVPGDVDESVVAVAGSVDESVGAPASPGDAVTTSGDPEVAPVGNVVDATEKVESWDLNEAVAKNVHDGDEKEDLKPKISEDGSSGGVDGEGAPVVSIDAIMDSVGGEPVSVSSHVEEETEDSGHAGGVTEVPSEIIGGEDVSPEIPAEGSSEKVGSEAVDAPVEEVHMVVDATNIAEPDEESGTLEAVPSPSDGVEKKSGEVNSGDVSEVASILPSESVDNEGGSSEIAAEGPSDNVDSEAVEAPVDSEKLDDQVVHEVVESTTGAQGEEGLAEPESVLAPADDVEEKSVEVNFEDISEAAIAEADKGSAEPEPVSVPAGDVEEKSAEVNSEETSEAVTVSPSESAENEDVTPKVPAEGPSDNVDSEALDTPLESEGLVPEVGDKVVEPTTSAETDEGSAEPQSASATVDVEEKSVEVSSEDTSEANTVMPPESAENDVNHEISAPGPSDIIDSKSLEAPVDSEGFEPEMVHEVVEPTISAEADEGSVKPESVAAPASDMEERSVELNSEDTSEANTVMPSEESADNQVARRELEPAEGSVDNVGNEVTLYAPVEEVHEVVEATHFPEPHEQSAEPESMSVPPDYFEDKSVEVNSGDVSETTTALESADNEAAGSGLPAEELADKLSSVGLEPEAVDDVVEPTTSAEPKEESAEPEHVSSPDHVENKSIEVNSEDTSEPVTVLPSESAGNKVVNSERPAEEVDQIGEAADSSTEARPDEESIELVFAPDPPDDIEDKSVVITEPITESDSADKEVVSSVLPAEEPADNVNSDALDAQALHEVVEPTTGEEPVKVSAEPESVSASSDSVEDKSIDLNSEDLTKVATTSESADNEDVSPEPSVEEPSGNVGSEVTLYAPTEEVHEVVEATIGAEANDESAESESVPAPSDDVEDGFVMVNSRDAAEDFTESESADNEIVSPELPAEASADKVDAPVEEIGEIEDAATDANPDEVSASREPVTAPSDDDQSTPKEVGPEVSAPETEESVMATSTPLPTDEEKSDLLEHEHVLSEVSHEGSVENGFASIGVDTATDTKKINAAEHPAEELLRGATSGDAPEGLSSEEPSDLSLSSHEEPLSTEDGVALVDRCIQVEELPQESAAESQKGVSTDAEVNAGGEEIAEGGDITKEESPETQSVSANRDLSVEDVSHMLQTEMTDEEAAHVATQPVEDVSHLLQTVMTDEEVKLAADHYPENSVAPEESVEDDIPALEPESSHEESLIQPAESSGASQANEVETVSREFNFNNFSEVPTTREVVREGGDESHYAVTSEQVTPYLATALAIASGEKGNSSDAAASDTTQLEISSSSPVVEKEGAPRSYNLDEVATNLHDAAEKALQNAKSSNIGDGQTSVAQSVAQIVLDESSTTGDPSEYISGVVQDVAQLAQDAASSDPNILPDTVARVFDGETAGSPAKEASQPQETASLGTMFSLLIVWCVSLCASRIPSKTMPAPALKLAAEEVTAVLHSHASSQPAPSHEAASSNH